LRGLRATINEQVVLRARSTQLYSARWVESHRKRTEQAVTLLMTTLRNWP